MMHTLRQMHVRAHIYPTKLHYKPTLQPTLQPQHHQLSHLTYGGVTAMDVHDQNNEETLIG